MRNSVKFFTMIILFVTAMSSILADTLTSMVYGEVVTGEIDSDQFQQLYTFEGQAGDVITITMQGDIPEEMILDSSTPRLDSFVTLRDPAGNDLISDDDTAGNLHAFIGPFVLPEAGLYTIIATRYGGEQGGTSGGYTLTLDLAELSQVAVDEEVTVKFNEANGFEFFTLTATESSVYRVMLSMVDGTGSADIMVRDDAGNHLNGVGVDPSSNSNFTVVTLRAGQSVTLFLRNYGDFDNDGQMLDGFAELMFDVASVDPATLDLTTTNPVSLTGTLVTKQTIDFYQFSANAGQTLAVTGSGEGGFFEIFVLSPNGIMSYYGGTYYNESGYILSPQILTMTGTHVVVIHRSNAIPENDPDVAITYDIEISLSETTELRDGVTEVVQLVRDNLNPSPAFIYNGRAGEDITVSLQVLTDSYGTSFSIEYTPAEMQAGHAAGFYVNFNSTTAGEITYNTTLPYDGAYIVRLYNGNYDPQVDVAEVRIRIDSND